MQNLINYIKRYCNDCKTVEGTVKFIAKRNLLKSTVDQDLEIWHFYNESLDLYSGRKARYNARRDTIFMFKISERKFWEISKKYKKKFRA